jgi:hypothetical protein
MTNSRAQLNKGLQFIPSFLLLTMLEFFRRRTLADRVNQMLWPSTQVLATLEETWDLLQYNEQWPQPVEILPAWKRVLEVELVIRRFLFAIQPSSRWRVAMTKYPQRYVRQPTPA